MLLNKEVKIIYFKFFISTIFLFTFTVVGIEISYLYSLEILVEGGAFGGGRYGNPISCISGLILIFVTRIIYDMHFNKIKNLLDENNKAILWFIYLIICGGYFALCSIKIVIVFAPEQVIIWYDLIVLFILPFFNIFLNIKKYKKNKSLSV
jgi:hypothetical protein